MFIDVDDTVKAIKSYPEFIFGKISQYDVARFIRNQPVVDAAPVVHGHWIEISLSNHTYKCSVCGRLLVNITDGKNNVAKHYPYCHCGAKMDVPDINVGNKDG